MNTKKRQAVTINSPEELKKGDVINGILVVESVYYDGDVWVQDLPGECPTMFDRSTVAQWLKDGATVTREIEETTPLTLKVCEWVSKLLHQFVCIDGKVRYWQWCTYGHGRGGYVLFTIENGVQVLTHGSVIDLMSDATEYRPEPIEPVVVEYEGWVDESNNLTSDQYISVWDQIRSRFKPGDQLKVRIEKVSK